MPTTSETIQYDSFFTLTLKNYSKQLEKNFLEYRPAVSILFDQYAHKDTRGGRIWQGIAEYGINNTVKFFAGAETFSQEVAQVAQPIMYPWKYLGGSVSMTKTEMLENSGPVALADLLEVRVKQALRTMNLVIGQEIFSDGSNYGGQTFQGLGAIISATPSTDPSTGAVGGLSAATWNFWRNNFQAAGDTFANKGVNGATGDYVLRNWNNCTDGMAETPTHVVSDQTLWEAYNRTNLQPVRYVDEIKGTADLTFRALEYQGRKWVWDRQAPALNLLFLNTKHVHFMTDPRCFFQWTEDMSYPNQLAYTRLVALRLALVARSRMFLGRLTFTG
jgi:hypothetical protein